MKHARTSKVRALVTKTPLTRGRVVGALAAVGIVAALGYAPAANAAAQITSAMIKDQTIGSVDIMSSGVGSSELRKNSVGYSEVQEDSVDSSELTNGGVKEEDLDEATRGKLNSAGEQGPKGDKGDPGPKGDKGDKGDPGASGYEVFNHTQDFSPGGIGGAWCGAPQGNTEDKGWKVVGGGAKLTPADINAGVTVASSWPNLSDPKNPAWNVQLNKVPNYDPGNVELYAVCVKA